MENILITGVTGTLGQQLSKLLLSEDEGVHVLGFSRDEQKQRLIKPHERLHLSICDVRDYAAMVRAVGNRKIDRIYHLAALKCVDTMEYHPSESIETNVLGTRNVLDLADQCGADLVFTSTDKACYPVNAYGQSKALAEKLVLRAGQTVVRYGNVVGSRGSLLAMVKESLLRDPSTVYITHPDMTRFWMDARDVARFVMNAQGNCVRLPQIMHASTVEKFMDCVAANLGIDAYKIVETGIRPGEKIHETLMTEEEGRLIQSSDKALHFSREDLFHFVGQIMKEMT